MSKGLEELEKLGEEYPSEGATLWFQYSERFSIIEKELKRLEELEKAFDALSKDDEKAKKLFSKEIEKNRAFEIISKAYGDYANHKISEYELIMIVGENTNY